MRIVTLPGVYRPRDDSFQLAEAIENAHELAPDARVLELCTGTGVVAVGLALRGHDVTAVDVSRRAALNVRLNARLSGVRIDARRGDLFGAVRGERFDLIVANPPYVPAPPGESHSGPARAWNAGEDGRLVLDRICRQAAEHLRPGGSILILQSSLADVQETMAQLGACGLETEVVHSEHVPLGPIAASRAEFLQERGLTKDGRERMTVIRGRVQAPVERGAEASRSEPADAAVASEADTASAAPA